ncbi:MAG: hypothetical protein LC797_19605 [Chloroflexi bacterium]|nr:hypothetical protein [Chloroflexota bacterium]
MRRAGERAAGADIVLLDGGGVEISRISRDQPEVALLSPAWLATGEVAYERSDGSKSTGSSRIEASQPDGSARRTLVAGGQLPGPDRAGTQLAYVGPGQRFARLLDKDLASAETHTLIDNSTEGFAYFSRPRFAPDGRTVAFGAAGGPTLAAPSGLLAIGPGLVHGSFLAAPRWHGPGWDVWTIGADGTGLRQVTQFAYEDDLAVAWSPDGQWLAAFGPNALYLVPIGIGGPATPIGRGGLGEPDWAASGLLTPSSLP